MRTESTPGARGPVFCGVDTHADSHWLCVLDWRGRKVLSRQFPADAAGYEALAGAIAAAGEPACVAMEGTSSYGAGLTRHLASLGMPVREACYRQWKIGQLRYCKLPNGVTPVYPTSTTPSQPSYGSLLLSVGTSLSL